MVSGTSSRTAPDDWANATLLLAAHGSTYEDGGNRVLHRQAAAIAERSLFARVQPIALNGSPSVEAALSDIATDMVYIAPLFMSAGKPVSDLSSEIASRLSNAGRPPRTLRMCPPLGIWSEITDLIELRAVELATAEKADPGETSLLVVGHGSTRSAAANNTTEWHADRLRRRRIFRDVRTAYLEDNPQAKRLLSALQAPAVVAGFFAGGGRHADEDLPRLIKEHAPGARYAGAMGADDLIPDILLSQVAGCSKPVPG